MHILSIDYGKKRTGIVVVNLLQIIADGLAAVSTSTLFNYLKDCVAREEVKRIVIGKPIQISGKPNRDMARVEQFIDRWQKAMPQIPIGHCDEHFMSVLAHKTMLASGVDKKAQQGKALVNEISATITL